MNSVILDDLEEYSKDTFTGKPLLEMNGSTHNGWMQSIRMIDRIAALQLVSRYNGRVTIFDKPDRDYLRVPEEIVSFAEQLDWLIDETLRITNKPRHWLPPERIEDGIRIFVYDFTYVEITMASGDDSETWFEIKIVSVTGGHRKINTMSRLLHALLEERGWLDESDLTKMVQGLGV